MGKSRKMTKRETLAMLEAERMSLADLGHKMGPWRANQFGELSSQCSECLGYTVNDGVIFRETKGVQMRCFGRSYLGAQIAAHFENGAN